jgi:hypothetical protein
VVERGDGDLLEVVLASAAAGRLAGALHGGQQQADERGDDRDHDQEFNKRETARASGSIQSRRVRYESIVHPKGSC